MSLYHVKIADLRPDPNAQHSLEWRPGTWGKGILFRDGALHTWPTQHGEDEEGNEWQPGDGYPTHGEHFNITGLGLNAKPEQMFVIMPNGASTFSPMHQEHIQKIDKRLVPGGTRWPEWDFTASAMPIIEMRTPKEKSVHFRSAQPDANIERRPFIEHEGKVYLGQPGTHHADVITEMALNHGLDGRQSINTAGEVWTQFSPTWDEPPGVRELGASPQALQTVADHFKVPVNEPEGWKFGSAELNWPDDPPVPDDRNYIKFIEADGKRYWALPDENWHADIAQRNGLDLTNAKAGVKHHQKGVSYVGNNWWQHGDEWKFSNSQLAKPDDKWTFDASNLDKASRLANPARELKLLAKWRKTMTEGDNRTLQAVLPPGYDESYRWSPGDYGKAMMNNGTLYGVKVEPTYDEENEDMVHHDDISAALGDPEWELKDLYIATPERPKWYPVTEDLTDDPDGVSDWRFGSAPQTVWSSWDSDIELQPWEHGSWGKALYQPSTGEIHSWRTDEMDGSPIHGRVRNMLGWRHLDDEMPLIIGPQGKVTAIRGGQTGQKAADAVAKHLGIQSENLRMYPEEWENDWDFIGKTAAMIPYDPNKPMPVGLPRPVWDLNGKLAPVPWSQDSRTWGTLDTGRGPLASYRSLCLVCGEPVLPGFAGKVFLEPNENDPEELNDVYGKSDLTQTVTPIIDRGPMHDRCAALTAAHCPHIKEGLAAGTIQMRPYDANHRWSKTAEYNSFDTIKGFYDKDTGRVHHWLTQGDEPTHYDKATEIYGYWPDDTLLDTAFWANDGKIIFPWVWRSELDPNAVSAVEQALPGYKHQPNDTRSDWDFMGKTAQYKPEDYIKGFYDYNSGTVHHWLTDGVVPTHDAKALEYYGERKNFDNRKLYDSAFWANQGKIHFPWVDGLKGPHSDIVHAVEQALPGYKHDKEYEHDWFFMGKEAASSELDQSSSSRSSSRFLQSSAKPQQVHHSPPRVTTSAWVPSFPSKAPAGDSKTSEWLDQAQPLPLDPKELRTPSGHYDVEPYTPYEPWVPGSYGKGFYHPEQKVWYGWRTNGEGSPHHGGGYRATDVGDTHQALDDSIVITPEGEIHNAHSVPIDWRFASIPFSPRGKKDAAVPVNAHNRPSEKEFTTFLGSRYEAPKSESEFSDKNASILAGFGSRKISTPMWETGDPLTPWQPGLNGKGFIHNGKPIAWAIDDWDSPHHDDAWDTIDPENKKQVQGYFYIHPNGVVESFAFDTPDNNALYQKFVNHDPRLKSSKPNLDWHFGSNGSHIRNASLQPWEPGNLGKGFFDTQGNIHTWNIDSIDGQPTHGTGKMLMGVNSDASGTEFWINPKGEISFWIPSEATPAHKKKLEDMGFIVTDIDNTEALMDQDWHFGSTLPKGVSPWELNHPGKGMVLADGTVVAWKTHGLGAWGAPHHGEVDGYLSSPGRTYFDIGHNGEYRIAYGHDTEDELERIENAGFIPDPSGDPHAWHFGSRYIDWMPGQYGKGVIDSKHNVHIWPVDDKGNPGHGAWRGRGNEPLTTGGWAWGSSFHINPEGEVALWRQDLDPFLQKRILESHPGLSLHDEEAGGWHFSSGPISDTNWVPPREVHTNMDPKDSEYSHWTHHNQTAFIYDPNEHTMYWGKPGIHHDDLMNEFNLDDSKTAKGFAYGDIDHDEVPHHRSIIDHFSFEKYPEVFEWARQKYRINPTPQVKNDPDEWNFQSAIQPAPPMTITEPYQDWKPGVEGKAIWHKPTNRLWAWQVNKEGEPHHFHVFPNITNSPDEAWNIPNYEEWEHFNIYPNGEVENWRGKDADALAAAYPNLFSGVHRDNWDF